MPLSEEESQKMWIKINDAREKARQKGKDVEDHVFLDELTYIFREFTVASAKTVQQPQVEKLQTKEDVEKQFTDELCELLSFEEKDDYIIIKPRQFLGSENFAKIAQIVRGIGGDYVSAGKQSHFRVPKKA
jgi:hypothetical protein